MVRFLPFLISLVLSVYALFSCIQTRDEDVPYLPKLVWIILIVFYVQDSAGENQYGPSPKAAGSAPEAGPAPGAGPAPAM